MVDAGTGLKQKRSCKYKAEGHLQMELEVQAEEKEGEEHRENAQCISLLVAHRRGSSILARLPKTDGWEGFPSLLTTESAGNGVSLLLKSSGLKLLLCLSGTWDSSSHLRHLSGGINKIGQCSSAAHLFCWS